MSVQRSTGERAAARAEAAPGGRSVTLVTAAVVGTIQGVLLVAGGLYFVVDGIAGSAGDVGRAVTEGVVLFLMALMPLLGARALLRRKRAGRSPVVVIQIVDLAVSYPFLAAGGGYLALGVPLLLLGLLGLATSLHPDTSRALGL